jgi:hypothetical protein
MKGIVGTIVSDVVDCVHIKKCELNIRVVKIIKDAVTLLMMTNNTIVMSIHTATKLISLLTVIDDKEQRTDNINNNLLPANFQRKIHQLTIFTGLRFYHVLQHGIHHSVKITHRSAFTCGGACAN